MEQRLPFRERLILDYTEEIPGYDIKKSRISAAFGYLCFFIPLTLHGDRQFARFHSNQALINLLLSTVGAVVLGMIPVAGPYLLLAQEAMCLVLAVRGVVLSLQGKARGIPLLGRIEIIAYRRQR